MPTFTTTCLLIAIAHNVAFAEIEAEAGRRLLAAEYLADAEALADDIDLPDLSGVFESVRLAYF